MLTRRVLIKNAGVYIGVGGSASLMALHSPAQCQGLVQWRMPDEGEPHLRTWMAFGASADFWGSDLLPDVQRNLAELARTIAKY